MAHLAQVNIAKGRGLLHSRVMASFVAETAEVNREAEAAPGFVWRMKGERLNALALQVFGDPLLVINLSVWESLEALRTYTFSAKHREIMRRRREWFDRMDGPHLALWWTPEGTQPSPQDGRDRLEHLAAHGPTPHAFTFAQTFDPTPIHG